MIDSILFCFSFSFLDVEETYFLLANEKLSRLCHFYSPCLWVQLLPCWTFEVDLFLLPEMSFPLSAQFFIYFLKLFLLSEAYPDYAGNSQFYI